MNIFIAQSQGLVNLLSGETITVINPFCKKLKAKKAHENSASIDYSMNHGMEIPVICTSVFHVENPSFSIISTKDNFKKYRFHKISYSEIYSERDYIPPRV